jgi:hypothetical protein
MDPGNYIYVFLRYFKRSATGLSLVIIAALVIGHFASLSLVIVASLVISHRWIYLKFFKTTTAN